MKKRNLIASLTLSLSLMFSKPRLNYSQLSSPNFDNKVAQVKFIDDKEFWSLEDNDSSLVILIKNQSSSKPATVRIGVAESLTSQGHFKKPSGRNLNGSKRNNLPSPRGFIEGKPTTGGRRELTRLGGAGNPGNPGSSSSANSDDGIPKVPGIKETENRHYDQHLNYQKKKSADQCELEEITDFDLSKYKDGPNPFVDKFDYDNPNYTRENTDFSSEKRMNHAYDRHAEKCFDMKENRNKKNLKEFEGKTRSFIESPETEKINGSYRYETPAFIYKEKNGNLVAVVNATDNSFITIVNATESQLESIEENQNFGLDTRPSMQLKLRLRGPRDNN